jgi:hypothetical protein
MLAGSRIRLWSRRGESQDEPHELAARSDGIAHPVLRTLAHTNRYLRTHSTRAGERSDTGARQPYTRSETDHAAAGRSGARDGIDYGSRVRSRAVRVYALPSGQRLVVEWYTGSAGPPSAAETELLRAALM